MATDNKLKKIILKALASHVQSNPEVTSSIWGKISCEISEDFYNISPLKVKEIFYKEVLPSLETLNYGIDETVIGAIRNLNTSLAISPSEKPRTEDNLFRKPGTRRSTLQKNHRYHEGLNKTLEFMEVEGGNGWEGATQTTLLINDPLNISNRAVSSDSSEESGDENETTVTETSHIPDPPPPTIGNHHELHKTTGNYSSSLHSLDDDLDDVALNAGLKITSTQKAPFESSEMTEAEKFKQKFGFCFADSSDSSSNEYESATDVSLNAVEKIATTKKSSLESTLVASNNQLTDAESFKQKFGVCFADSSDEETQEENADEGSAKCETNEADSTTKTPEPIAPITSQVQPPKQAENRADSKRKSIVLENSDDEVELETVNTPFLLPFLQQIVPFSDALVECKAAYRLKHLK